MAVFDVVLYDEPLRRIANLPRTLASASYFEGDISDLEVGDRRAENILVDAHLVEEERLANGADIRGPVA